MSTPTITLYGIPNCDTVKKARAWLTAQGIGHQFHDFKKQGVPSRPAGRLAATAGRLGNAGQPQGHHLAQAGRHGASQRPDAASARDADAGPTQRHQAPGGGLGPQTTVGFDPDAWQALR
jgi:hypothetical protein